MKSDTFYDIHCHAMNLSHPNILAFVGQLRTEHKGLKDALFGPYSSFFLQKPLRKIKNMLAVMENDMASLFMLMEDDLAGVYLENGEEPLLSGRTLTIGDRLYSRIVITPLIMDFEHRSLYGSGIHYSRPPEKPITEQIVDVIGGIKEYRKRRPEGMLEIYPFLGINTRNYTLKQLESLLQKYFGLYRPLKGMFRNVYSTLLTLPVSVPMIGTFHFAGIKLYPPLGFDPWPTDSGEELEKVKFLYGYCEKLGIPITTHCSDSGFNVIDEKTAELYTSPERWTDVLGKYPLLKLNFAHMGMQYRKKLLVFNRHDWLMRIFSLIEDYPNVYTDFSFIGATPGFYGLLRETLAGHADPEGKVPERILFGSDFLINLIEIDSYYEYVRRFSETQDLSSTTRHGFCSTNPERFLFG